MARTGIFALSLLLLAPFFVSLGRAATDTATFEVRIEILTACTIASANDLDFGSHGFLNANIDATTTLGIQCTASTPYDVGLSAGSGGGATVSTRLMTGPGSATIGYSLYKDSGRTVVWGDTGSPDVLVGTGNGSIQSLTVYGRVPGQPTPIAGNYIDTVTVTLTF